MLDDSVKLFVSCILIRIDLALNVAILTEFDALFVVGHFRHDLDLTRRPTRTWVVVRLLHLCHQGPCTYWSSRLSPRKYPSILPLLRMPGGSSTVKRKLASAKNSGLVIRLYHFQPRSGGHWGIQIQILSCKFLHWKLSDQRSRLFLPFLLQMPLTSLQYILRWDFQCKALTSLDPVSLLQLVSTNHRHLPSGLRSMLVFDFSWSWTASVRRRDRLTLRRRGLLKISDRVAGGTIESVAVLAVWIFSLAASEFFFFFFSECSFLRRKIIIAPVHRWFVVFRYTGTFSLWRFCAARLCGRTWLTGFRALD